MQTLFRAAIFDTPVSPFREGSALRHYADGGLVVENGRIVYLGDFEAASAQYPGAEVCDWRDGVILPGFVDAHVHFPQVRAMAGLGLELLEWLDQIALPQEAQVADAAFARRTAGEFVHCLLSHGTTAAMVFGAHFAGAVAELFAAAQHVGIALTTGLVVSDRALRSDLHVSPQQARVESEGLLHCFHGKGRLRYAVTPRFALSTSESMLEVCGELLEAHPDIYLQTHLNENLAEVAVVAQAFPWAADYLNVYERYGFVRERSVFAHNVHASLDQIGRLRGAAVAHCPSSNAGLSSGFFRLREHLEAEVRVGIGSDIGAGISFSIPREAVQTYLLQRLAPNGLTLTPEQLLYLATRGGAEAIGLGEEIGDLTPGKFADFVYIVPTPQSPLDLILRDRPDNLAAIVSLSGPEAIREVRVAGEPVYCQGRLGTPWSRSLTRSYR